MWKPEHRRAADRTGPRYPSDLTDAEWGIVEPMISSAKHGGRRRSVIVREVLNGIFYVLWTGCQRKALPKHKGREASPTVAIIDSQTPKASQKGGFARSFGPRPGQEDQGSQAADPDRHARPLVERLRSSRRCPGPRWCFPLAAPGPMIAPVPRTNIC